MNLRSAARGFLAFLLLIPALQGGNDWTVTHTPSEVCTVTGSTVNISSTYEHPDQKQQSSTGMQTQWFTKLDRGQPVDIGSAADYQGRVEYSCGETQCIASSCSGACTLTIKDLRQSDSAEYKFWITTAKPRWGYTGNTGVTLTVTDLQVKVVFLDSAMPTKLDLECHSACGLANPTYKWFRNGEKAGPGRYYRGQFNSEDSYACSVEGFERFHSPSVYAPKTPSVTVSPSGEIEEGSSVTLSCSSDANPAAKYTWFKEHEDSVEESGQNYAITNIKSEHGGRYYCQAHNTIGRHNSTWLSVNMTERSSSSSSSLSSLSPPVIAAAAVGTALVFLATILLLVFLLLRRRRASRKARGQGGRPDTTEESLPVAVYDNGSALTNHSAPAAQGEAIEQHYAVINLTRSETQEVPHRLAGSHVQSDETEQVLYSAVNFQRPNAVPEHRDQTETGETSEMYSTVQNQHRV